MSTNIDNIIQSKSGLNTNLNTVSQMLADVFADTVYAKYVKPALGLRPTPDIIVSVISHTMTEIVGPALLVRVESIIVRIPAVGEFLGNVVNKISSHKIASIFARLVLFSMVYKMFSKDKQIDWVDVGVMLLNEYGVDKIAAIEPVREALEWRIDF